jgi:hypothetical protein
MLGEEQDIGLNPCVAYFVLEISHVIAFFTVAQVRELVDDSKGSSL